MEKPTESQELNSFRESLKDVVVVLTKMTSHCENLEELIGVTSLALKNDGQLKLLYATITAQAKR